MSAVRIIVSALGDNSLPTAFDPFVASAKKAQAQVRRELAGTSAVAKREADKSAREAARANDAIRRQFEKRNADEVRVAERASQARERAARREFDARLRESARARVAEERDIMRTAAAQERIAKRSGEKVLSARRETVSRVGNAIGGLARRGVGIAADGLSGMGLDLSFGSLLGKGVNLSAQATKTTQSGMGAQGKTATLDDVKATEAAIRAAGNATAQDYGRMAGALDAFVGATGDLEGGKKQLEELGKISNMTGAPLEDLGLLAGKLSKDLGNVPNKAERVSDALRNLALQGMLGNVELEDLAKFGGRISGNAFKFAGDKNQVIAELGAAAQISMQGGRVDAAEATNSAARFASQMGNKNVQDNIREALGKDFQFYTDDTKTKMRGPAELITDIVSRADGNNDKIAAAFKNVMPKSVIEGFTSIYQDAGGGAAGKDALANTFKTFSRSLSKEQLDKGNALTMGGDAAKIQKANNDLADAALALVPALRAMLPAVTEAAKWISNNLGTAITAAVIASIAKAALGDAISKALTGAIAGGGGGAAGAGLGAGGKVVPALAAGAAGFLGTKAILDWADKQNERAGNNVASLEMDAVKTSNAAQKGDVRSLLQLMQQIQHMKALEGAGDMAAIGNREGWHQRVGELEGDRDAMMSKLSPTDRVRVMTSFFSGDRSQLEGVGIQGGRNAITNEPVEVRGGASGSGGSGASEMKGAADAHVQAANSIQSAIGQMVAAVAAAAAKGGPGVDPSGRH